MKNKQIVKAVACALRGNHDWEGDFSKEAAEYEEAHEGTTYCMICSRCGAKAVDTNELAPWTLSYYR